MKIVTISNNLNDACGLWRIKWPLEHLAKLGHDVQTTSIDTYGNLGRAVSFKGALVILHRLLLRDAEAYIKDIRESGAKRIIYELDDNIVNSAYIQYIKDCGRYSEQGLKKIERNVKLAIETMKQCDAVTVSTIILKEVVQQVTDKPVIVLNNAIDIEWFGSRLTIDNNQNNEDYTTVGWAGGFRPESDMKTLAAAWEIINQSYKNKVKFIIAGWQSDSLYEAVDYDSIIKVPWKSLDEWPVSMQMDIGCISVPYNGFNMCKSPIKFMEYSLAGTAVVAQMPNASIVITPGLNAYLADSVWEFVENISKLIDNKELREEFAKIANYSTNKYNNIKYHVQDWGNAYEMVMG